MNGHADHGNPTPNTPNSRNHFDFPVSLSSVILEICLLLNDSFSLMALDVRLEMTLSRRWVSPAYDSKGNLSKASLMKRSSARLMSTVSWQSDVELQENLTLSKMLLKVSFDICSFSNVLRVENGLGICVGEFTALTVNL